MTKIYVVDNGHQDIKSKIKHPNIEVIENEKNVGVANSINQLCNLIFEWNDYAIILNDDIYLGRKDWEVDNLLTNFQKDFYVTMQDWCAFIMPKKTFKEVGEFDGEFFPAYYEDDDYKYRMKLKGKNIFQIPFLNPFLFQNSQTIEKEPSFRPLIENCKKRFIEKWGGEPNHEKFKTPFNKK
jgi:GT2 family glycosyltransferase